MAMRVNKGGSRSNKNKKTTPQVAAKKKATVSAKHLPPQKKKKTKRVEGTIISAANNKPQNNQTQKKKKKTSRNLHQEGKAAATNAGSAKKRANAADHHMRSLLLPPKTTKAEPIKKKKTITKVKPKNSNSNKKKRKKITPASIHEESFWQREVLRVGDEHQPREEEKAKKASTSKKKKKTAALDDDEKCALQRRTTTSHNNNSGTSNNKKRGSGSTKKRKRKKKKAAERDANNDVRNVHDQFPRHSDDQDDTGNVFYSTDNDVVVPWMKKHPPPPPQPQNPLSSSLPTSRSRSSVRSKSSNCSQNPIITPTTTTRTSHDDEDHHHRPLSSLSTFLRQQVFFLQSRTTSNKMTKVTMILDRLDDELHGFGTYVQLTRIEMDVRNKFVNHLHEHLIGPIYQHGFFQVFGSFATPDICTFYSDLDLALWGCNGCHRRVHHHHHNHHQNNIKKKSSLIGQDDEEEEVPAPPKKKPRMSTTATSSSTTRTERVERWTAALAAVDDDCTDATSGGSDNNDGDGDATTISVTTASSTSSCSTTDRQSTNDDDGPEQDQQQKQQQQKQQQKLSEVELVVVGDSTMMATATMGRGKKRTRSSENDDDHDYDNDGDDDDDDDADPLEGYHKSLRTKSSIRSNDDVVNGVSLRYENEDESSENESNVSNPDHLDDGDGCNDMEVSFFASSLKNPPRIQNHQTVPKRLAQDILDKVYKATRSRAAKNKIHVTNLMFIKKARVPIIKMMIDHGFEADIAVGGSQEADTSLYAKQQCEKYASFAPVVLFLKVLLKQHALDVPFNGGLGSYKLYVLVAYHLKSYLALKGTRDRPGEVLLSFFYRYSAGDSGGTLQGLRTPLRRDTPLEGPDGGIADLKMAYQLPAITELFQQCRKRLFHQVRSSQDLSHKKQSVLACMICAKQLDQERKSCLGRLQQTETVWSTPSQDDRTSRIAACV